MTPSELLTRYESLGFRLVYWERKGQNPRDWKGPTEKGWNNPTRAYPISGFNPEVMNLGLFTGCEISPGKFLADADFDWAPGIDLAARIFPSTGFAFGRKGKKISHALFTTPERLECTKYYDFADDEKGTGEGDCFVELRGGEFSHQTMIAPSLHSPGVKIELVLSGTLLHVEVLKLQQAALDYAIGCMLLKRIPGGLHHDGRKALAGFLLLAGVPADRVTLIGEEVCRVQASQRVPDMSSKDVSDMPLVVRSTLKRIESGKKIEGGPTLAEFIGGKVGKHVLARLNKWLGREDDFARDGNGRIIAKNRDNVQRAISLLGHALSYNQFAEKMLIDGQPLEDPQWKSLLLDIETEFRFQPPPDYFRLVLEDTAWRNGFHPVKQYLDGLTWDKKPRVDTWLIKAAKAEDTPYVRAISAILLIAAVRRIRQPGCKYDEMVIWESHQGSLKSSAAQALCPNPDWFSDDLHLNVQSKELIEATLGKWIIEASDLAGKRKTETEQLKAMLSRQVDGPARMAYAHFPVERPRHFILIGTTNSAVYSTDPTGGRRFWPMAVGRFDVAWIVANRDQLWAEACVREAAGESIRLREELWPDASKHQERRREIDPWEGALRKFLLTVPTSSDRKTRVTTTTLWEALTIPLERRDRYGALRISETMQRLGFKRTRVRPAGEELQVGYMNEYDTLTLLDDAREPGEDDASEIPSTKLPEPDDGIKF